MDTRHLIAYLLMAIMAGGIIALWIALVRKRRRHRDMMRGRYGFGGGRKR